MNTARTIVITDDNWKHLQPLITPVARRRGRPRTSDRLTFSGILYVFLSGCRWDDVPDIYCSGGTCWRRFRQWEADGTWERLWLTFLTLLDDSARDMWCTAFLNGNFVPVKKRAHVQRKLDQPTPP